MLLFQLEAKKKEVIDEEVLLYVPLSQFIQMIDGFQKVLFTFQLYSFSRDPNCNIGFEFLVIVLLEILMVSYWYKRRFNPRDLYFIY